VQLLAERVKPIAWNICIAYKRKRTLNSAQEEFLRAVGVAPVWQSKESIA
jgi:hypothetical protein